MTFKVSPLLACDSYKLGHMAQYPEGTEFVYSNFTPRSVAHLNIPKDYKREEIVFFGLRGVITEMVDMWRDEFFSKDIELAVKLFEKRITPFVGPSGFDTEKLRDLWHYQRLPIKIFALPEGSRVPVGVPVFTIENIEAQFYWFTNFIETYLSCELWKMSTSATIADAYKRILIDFADQTGSPHEFVEWQGHDFSMRGMSGVRDAAVSSAGHLLSFTGTDSLPAVEYLAHYYDGDETFIGGSVPATEHSVMCMGGEGGEVELFRRLITEVYPAGVVSIVSDTWDFFRVITEYAAALKPEIMARATDDIGLAKVVFRPDSGDPVEILCGIEIEDITEFVNERRTVEDIALEILKCRVQAETPHGEYGEQNPSGLFRVGGDVYNVVADIEWNRYDKQYYYVDGARCVSIEKVTLTPKEKGAVECLWDTFGGTETTLGYKVLDSHVGLIYGDSITPQRAIDIMKRLKAKGFASCNVVLGIGSFTYQYNTRDSLGFAMKATFGIVNGEPREIFKAPKTDSGIKKSACGLLRVTKDKNGRFVLEDRQPIETHDSGELVEIFDEYFTSEYPDTLEDIRARLKETL